MKGKGKLVVLGVTILMVAALVVNGCARAPKVKVEEWHFPCIVTLTGMLADYGIQGKFAMEEAVKDINAAGGVAGKPLRMTFYDGGTDADKARAEMSRVLDGNPLMAALCTGTYEGFGAMPLAIEGHVFTICTAFATGNLREWTPWGLSFIPYIEHWAYGPVLAWMEAEPDIKSVVSFYDVTDPGYLAGAEQIWTALGDKGVEVVGAVTYDQATTVDFGPMAVAALAQDADGYTFNSAGDAIAKTIIELHRRGMTEKRRIYIGVEGNYPGLFEVGAGYLDGCYTATFFDPDSPDPRWQSIKQRWEETHPDIGVAMGLLHGYDVPWVFKAAVEATGITGDPAKLCEERIMLAQWLYNAKDYPFLQASADIVSGIAHRPMAFNVIENNENVFADWSPIPPIPELWLDAPQVPTIAEVCQ